MIDSHDEPEGSMTSVTDGGPDLLGPRSINSLVVDLLRPFRSVTIGVFDGAGATVDCNEGFRALVEAQDIPLDAVAPFFVNPSFVEIIEAVGRLPSGRFLDGRITVGPVVSWTLRGAFYAHHGLILFAAEHDVAEQGRVNDVILALNEELSTAQRDLVKANQALSRREKALEKIAHSDPLTDLPNRRAMQDRLPVELERVRRYGRPLCLAITDIDHFKDVNDAYGHETGDAALVQVARTLKERSRQADFVGRWGGEEFILLLPETSLDAAVAILDRLRCDIGALDIPPLSRPLTVSVGVTQAAGTDEPDKLFRRADQALYAAKQAGRDRVVASDILQNAS